MIPGTRCSCRVTHLSHTLGPGGKERILLDLARNGRASGHDDRILLFDRDVDAAIDLDPGGIPVRFLPRSRGFDRRFGTRLARALEESGTRVPCDKYRMIWVGADGTVQLCYVTFRLDNPREHRLRDLLFGPEHRAAARRAFRLDCPNCHCGYDTRIERHLPSRARYGRRSRNGAS